MAGGGTVTFACDDTITLAVTITNTADTVLDGSGHQITISGGDTVRVFTVATNVSLGVVNLTIANGFGGAGGGILNLGGRVNLAGVQVHANTASYEAEPQFAGAAAGGGIFNQGGKVNATNCVFSSNRAEQQSDSSTSPSRTRGGALCNESGEVRLQSCSFYGNSVAGAPGPFNIRGTAHEANGGAIANSGTLAATGCTFVANSAGAGEGGGIAGEGGAGNGGAVCNLGFLELSECTFLSNSVTGGRGGEGASGMPGNPPGWGGPGGPGGSGNGGALFNAGVVTVASSTFTGNVGSGGNGGPGGAGYPNVYPYPYGGAGGNGGVGGSGGPACGAICDINALCRLTNCTVSANAGIKGAGGPGGPGGAGNPNGDDGPAGPDGLAMGSLRSVGAVVMNTVFTANAPGGDCSDTVTDGGGNASSDCRCNFTNHSPPKPGATATPPFYLLHNFTGQELSYVDAHPFAPLTTTVAGLVYGVTAGGAWPGGGAVFKLNTNGTDSSFTVLRGFGYDPTYGPAGALAWSGNVMYGTTVLGGQSNLGTVFKINTDGSGYAILHSFTGVGDGKRPSAGVLLSGSTLFGTTRFGGSANYGTIFRIETNGSGYSIIKNFPSGTNGGPISELVLSGTTLYGTTIGGGSPASSTIFKINTDGSGYAVLTDFDGVIGSGAQPSAGLVRFGSTLFGTTIATCHGGQSDCGSVFKINTDGGGFGILKQFPAGNSPGRHAGLILSGGYLFGTTSGDEEPTSYGTVFMMDVDGRNFTVLRQFNGADGAGPNGNLYISGNTLFGTTANGGYYGAGVAFGLSLSPPVIAAQPQSRTVELGDNVDFTMEATGLPAPSCQWFFNTATPVSGATGLSLHLQAVQFSQSGAYTLALTSPLGALTSAPVTLNVIPRVLRKPILGVKLSGETGSWLNLDCANTLSPAPSWTPLDCVRLTSTSQYWFDDTVPLPPQRFYRAWQTGTPKVIPTLDLQKISTITLAGNLGDTVRVDGINAVGPTDAWFTLATVTLTNTSQLYFDVTASGQPLRLYRIVPVP